MQPNYEDPFTDPRGGSGEPGPTMSELAGRTIAIVVQSYDPYATYRAPGDKEDKPRPHVIGDLYVLDGGPLNYGGSDSVTEPKPPTHTIQIPAKFDSRYFGQVNIVSALRDAAPIVMDANHTAQRGTGLGGPVLGLVERSTVGGKPWNLVKLNAADPERGAQFAALRANAARVYMAGQQDANVWRTHAQHGVSILSQQAETAAPYGGWPQGAAPAAPGVDPNYAAFLAARQQAAAQAVFAAQQAAQAAHAAAQAPAAPPMDPAYAAFLAQQAAAQAPPAPPAAPVDPAYAAWQAQQAAAAAQIPAVPAGVIPAQAGPPAAELDTPPTGYEAIWSTMTPEMKAQVRQAVAAQQGTAQGRPNPF